MEHLSWCPGRSSWDSWGGRYSRRSCGFYAPSGVTIDGTPVWVTNLAGNSVTEIRAREAVPMAAAVVTSLQDR